MCKCASVIFDERNILSRLPTLVLLQILLFCHSTTYNCQFLTKRWWHTVPEPFVEVHGVGDGVVPLHGYYSCNTRKKTLFDIRAKAKL
jgi:hypothetical protein